MVAELLDAAALSQAQSWDWDAYYDQTGTGTKGAYVGKKMPKFPTGNVSRWSMFDHGVNNAMGTKSGAVWYRQSGKKSDAQRSYQKLTVQDEHQGPSPAPAHTHTHRAHTHTHTHGTQQ